MSFGTRLVAADSKATYRPSALMLGEELPPPTALLPPVATLTRLVWATAALAVASASAHASRRTRTENKNTIDTPGVSTPARQPAA